MPNNVPPDSIAREVAIAIGCPDWVSDRGCDASRRDHDKCYCHDAALAVLARHKGNPE